MYLQEYKFQVMEVSSSLKRISAERCSEYVNKGFLGGFGEKEASLGICNATRLVCDFA